MAGLSCAWGQEKPQDRRKFLDPSTPVSDDPRRLPVAPGPRSPEGTLEAGKLADVLEVAGRPDENLEGLTRVEVVIRDGYVEVQGGQVVTPRHPVVALKGAVK